MAFFCHICAFKMNSDTIIVKFANHNFTLSSQWIVQHDCLTLRYCLMCDERQLQYHYTHYVMLVLFSSIV